ncbi:MAG: aspartate kinase [Rickettsiaceae bacterium]|nr:aspartate kinase [Rickettsiaceae bacterium]
MQILVQKFGGTSVASTSKIINAATKVVQSFLDGYKPIVVVSAMAGVTNQLISYCSEISKLHKADNLVEYDAAISNGENISAALMALALQNLGMKARSFQGWQIPIITNANSSKALIEGIDSGLLMKSLENGVIPVITGFQGINTSGQITTLGRGGSDITAVAIAASTKAYQCDIYTDVAGVYTADPRFVPSAKKLENMSYEEMLEFSVLGAKVLHWRAVEIAMKYQVPTRVLSTFENAGGTLIYSKANIMEKVQITGIAYNDKIIIIKTKSAQRLQDIILEFSNENISINNISLNDDTCTLMAALIDLPIIKNIFNKLKLQWEYNSDVALISVVGIGINNDINILNTIINIVGDYMTELSLTSTKINFIYPLNKLESSIKLLHKALIESN